MCGIVGRLNFRSGRPVDYHVLREMTDLIAHRGPDDEGWLVHGPVGLGNRRLAIVDLSPGGHQPMASADGTTWITYNGEIYNFRELRKELEARGHRFRSDSDTEVLLAAYREYGIACLDRLRGMFAFAIWDDAKRQLLLARDRLGKKPLTYRLDEDGIAFASEAKSFLAEPGFVPTPDREAIWHYLTYQYVPSPHSAFVGVRKLRPAHYLLVRDGEVLEERYWRLSYANKLRIGEEEAAARIREALREAVRMRLISDVPLGAFLSGGIDSSAIVAMMAELSSRPVKTFSIGFEHQEYDERRYARIVAQRFGTDHHEFVVRADATRVLPELVWHYGEPFADSSAIPTYYLAKLTREHVTVALSGDAGDENFAGYDRYFANVLSARADAIPKGVRLALARLARYAPDRGGRTSMLRRGRRVLEALAETRERRYLRWVSQFDAQLKSEIVTPAFAEAAGSADSGAMIARAFADSDAAGLIDATLDVDVNTYLPEDLLVKMDIATMAHSLEARSPFLDHVFMELCASLPSQLKLRGRVKKYILKRAMHDLLPHEIVDRPKMGFGVPLANWFKGELRDMAYETLLGQKAMERGYFRRAVVQRLLDEHTRGERNWQYQLWNLLVLEEWHRIYVDERGGSRSVLKQAGVTRA